MQTSAKQGYRFAVQNRGSDGCAAKAMTCGGSLLSNALEELRALRKQEEEEEEEEARSTALLTDARVGAAAGFDTVFQ